MAKDDRKTDLSPGSREARLAAALRTNLRRRKVSPSELGPDPAPYSPSAPSSPSESD